MRERLALVIVAGCYDPTIHAGIPCGTNEACPTGLMCIQGVCNQPGGSGSDAAADSALLADTLPTGMHVVPSNGVDWTLAGQVSEPITLASATQFDTDSGAITGGLTRMPGTGVMAGVGYYQISSGSAELGVFVFEDLDVTSGAVVTFTGGRSAVFYAGAGIAIDGTIDLSGGCSGHSDITCAGPGGGSGATASAGAGGCAGNNGASATSGDDDSGGGGAGGTAVGGGGGVAGSTVGGTGGPGCIPAELVPLVGGGGGGAGGPGSSPIFPEGGGGGGALQLTSQTQIDVSGVITSGGAGGRGGQAGANGMNSSAGAGGGAGGGVMLEAPVITLATTAIIAANGGGGGGGGNSSNVGGDGKSGAASSAAAMGGAGVASPGPGNGGNGGALGVAATGGGNGTNAGGGGGAAGAICVRSSTISTAGTLSPAATPAPIVIAPN
ncbi:MAG TPA: hypothetical protein VMJ10_13490 [Kofleriaceae bacterium]|nr:hypothetical protein [Kofleriaceae bacterium]